MKRVVLLAAMALVVSGGCAFAQSDAAPQGPPQGKWQHHHHAPDPQKQTEFLTKKLGLSADQAAKLEPILADRQQKMAALHSNTSLSHADMKTQSFAIMKDSQAQIATVLTPEQLEQMKAMHHGHRGGGHGQWQGQQGQGKTAPLPGA